MLHQFAFEELLSFTKNLFKEVSNQLLLKTSYDKIIHRLTFLCKVGLSYLTLQRPMGSLSAGEAQRIKLAGLLGSNLQGLTIILDEPTRGMHPSEVASLISVLQELQNRNNTLLVIEHDLDVIRAGSFLIELGPKAGREGGQIVNSGPFAEFIKHQSLTTNWLNKNNSKDIYKY